MRKHTFAAAIILLLGLMLNSGIAHAQQLPNGKGMPLGISLSYNSLTVPVYSICSPSVCPAPVAVNIETCPYGGTAPYYLVIYQNNRAVDSVGTRGCYNYSFTPQYAGTYDLLFKATDSATPSNTVSTTAMVVAAQQNGGGQLSASISLSRANVNVSQLVPITVKVIGGVPPYTIRTYNNGNLVNRTITYAPYTYAFVPASSAEYTIQFEISDVAGKNINQSSIIYSIPGIITNIGTPNAGQLTVSATPAYKSVLPGTPVVISATASGGTPPYSMLIYDGSGTTLARTSTGFISYSYVGYSPNTYYPVTVSASDSKGSVAGKSIDIQTTSIAGGVAQYVKLSELLSPQSQSVSIGQQARFTTVANGGVPPYYVTIRNGTGNVIAAGFIASDGTGYNYTLKEGALGVYSYTFQVTDSAFNTAYGFSTVTTTGYAIPPTQQSGGAIGSTVGQTVKVSVSPSQYPCPCSILVYVNGAYQQQGSVQNYNSAYSYSFTPTVSGTYVVNLVVSYAGGASDTTTYTVNVGALPQSGGPGTLSLVASPIATTATIGVGRQFALSVSGGTPPYYLIIRNGTGQLIKTDYIQSPSTPYFYNVTEAATGDYGFTFQVTDGNFNNAYVFTNLVVTNT
ncbi:MAG TPA: hypothetical protein VND15_04065 [Candidatus Acidoferrales bacterium]|nr:hypothetical protein [Candidatus Acidoferrales bacterium]